MQLEIIHEDENSCGYKSYFLFATDWFEIGFTREGFMDDVTLYQKSIWIRFGKKCFMKEWKYKTAPLTEEQEKQIEKMVKNIFARSIK